MGPKGPGKFSAFYVLIPLILPHRRIQKKETMKATTSFTTIVLVFCLSAFTFAGPVDEAIRTIRQVQVEGKGSTSAAAAWKQLAKAEPSELPKILAGMKDADPIVSNWLASAADAVAQKAFKKKGTGTIDQNGPAGAAHQWSQSPFPVKKLEKFVLDKNQSGQARTLAYDWLCQVDPSNRERLLPKLLGDPCSALCQKAVLLAIKQTEVLEKANADKADLIASYQKTLDIARDSDQIRDLALRLKKLGHEVDLAAQLGFIVDWQIVGPFDASGDDGFARVFPPEGKKRFTFKEIYEGKPTPDDETKKSRTLRWIKHHAKHPSGHVDLNKVVAKEKGVTAYVATVFVSDREQDVELRMSSHNGLQIWVNGQSVGVFEFYHSGGQFDLYRVKAKLRKGENTIVMKVRQDELIKPWTEGWWYRFRVCDPLGYGVTSKDRE